MGETHPDMLVLLPLAQRDHVESSEQIRWGDSSPYKGACGWVSQRTEDCTQVELTDTLTLRRSRIKRVNCTASQY